MKRYALAHLDRTALQAINKHTASRCPIELGDTMQDVDNPGVRLKVSGRRWDPRYSEWMISTTDAAGNVFETFSYNLEWID